MWFLNKQEMKGGKTDYLKYHSCHSTYIFCLHKMMTVPGFEVGAASSSSILHFLFTNLCLEVSSLWWQMGEEMDCSTSYSQRLVLITGGRMLRMIVMGSCRLLLSGLHICKITSLCNCRLSFIVASQEKEHFNKHDNKTGLHQCNGCELH